MHLLKKAIEFTFPDKKVYAVGAYASKFKFLGYTDKEENIDYSNSLLIVLDTPITKRIDIENIDGFAYKIKIDHHPFEEKFCDLEIVDDTKSSTCEMIIELCNNTKLKLDKTAAENLYEEFGEKLNGVEDYVKLKDSLKDIPLNELEEKLYSLVGRVQFKLNTKNNNSKSPKVGVAFSVTDKDEKPYGDLFSY